VFVNAVVSYGPHLPARLTYRTNPNKISSLSTHPPN
jgi:hypothetical protein